MPSFTGPGIVIRRDEFGAGPLDAAPDDSFAQRQDAIAVLNDALSETDTAAAEALESRRASFFAGEGEPAFAAGLRELLAERRKGALAALPDPASRDEMADAFARLTERHLRRATRLEQEARVHARAGGAERALQRLASAAVVDPDGLPDRIADAGALLGRMVEAGTDPEAAATRATQFKDDVARAMLDDLAERDPRGAIARLDGGLFDGVLGDADKASARERLGRVAQADAAAQTRRAEFSNRAAEFERAAARRSAVRALTAGLRGGTMDESHIARALYRGEVQDGDADALRAQLVHFDAERLRRAGEIDRFDAAVKDGAGIVGGERWEPEVIDAWFCRERQRGAPPREPLSDCFRIARRIPQPAIDELRTMILSSSSEDSVQAGRDFAAIRDSSREAADILLAGLPRQEASKLSALAEYAHLDLPAERVEELAEHEGQGERIAGERRPVEIVQNSATMAKEPSRVRAKDPDGTMRERPDLRGMTVEQVRDQLTKEGVTEGYIHVPVDNAPQRLISETLTDPGPGGGPGIELIYETPGM